MNNKVHLSKNDAKFKNARSVLLVVMILSLVNVVFPLLGIDVFFYYGSFLGAMFAISGMSNALIYADNMHLIIGAALALLSAAPLVVCYFVSKTKKFVGMLVATIYFSIDTIIMIYMMDMSMLTGAIIHVIVIVFLIIGVVYSKKASEDEKKFEAADQQEMVQEALKVESDEPETPAEPRILKITRPKNFIGCAIPMVCYVNGKEVCRLKNNQSTEVTVDSRRFEFGVALTNGMVNETEHIGEGTAQISLVLKMKAGMIANKIVIERE